MKWLSAVIAMGLILSGLTGCQNKKNPLSLDLLGKSDLGQEKKVTIEKMDAVKIGTFEGQTAFSAEIFAGQTHGKNHQRKVGMGKEGDEGEYG